MLNVNHSKGYYNFDIPKCEKKYNAKYIGDFQTKRKDGTWNDNPCAIFYVENPDISKGHSHYFGLFMNIISIEPIEYGPLYITNGISAVEEPFYAIQADNGEYVISSYRHDYRVSTDESVSIDGGRDYQHVTSKNNNYELVKLKLNKDKFELWTEI